MWDKNSCGVLNAFLYSNDVKYAKRLEFKLTVAITLYTKNINAIFIHYSTNHRHIFRIISDFNLEHI
jgi:hypothetical protein